MLGISLFALFLIFLCAGGLFGLWISALVTVLSNPVVKKDVKIPWFLLIFFVNPIGPIVFFFIHKFNKRAIWTLVLTIIPLILWLIFMGGLIGSGIKEAGNLEKNGWQMQTNFKNVQMFDEEGKLINFLGIEKANAQGSIQQKDAPKPINKILQNDSWMNQPAEAGLDTDTNRTVRSSMVRKINYVLAGLGMICVIAVIGFGIGGLVLSLMNKEIKETSTRVLWFLLIFFVSPIGSIVYFFVFKHKLAAWLNLTAIVLPIFVLIAYAVLNTLTII